jgi:hypothetical protein
MWRQRAKELKRQGIKTTRDVADYLIRSAKGMAPRKTGATRQGLRVKPRAKGHVAESWVPGRFKQNLWANQTAPFRTIHPWWNQGKATRYGDGSHKTTGQPQFFHLATLRARTYNSKIARQNTQKALRVSIT